MKLTHYIYIVAAVAALASCGDFNEKLDGYDADTYKPVDIKQLSITLNASDYDKIASLVNDNTVKNKYFKSNDDATKYIPVWLKNTYPTADNGSTAKVTFSLLATTNSESNVAATSEPNVVSTTAPFELVNQVWKYNPSVQLTLPNEKGNATSKQFYARVAAWVKKNYDDPNGFDKQNPGGYLNKYGDTEYFSGTNSYKNQVDWIAADAKSNTPSVYGSMTDDEVVATMQKNLITTFGESLREGYTDAEPVAGMDVVYTVNFTAHMAGDQLLPYTIKYLVTGKGEFTYVEGSLQLAK